MGCARKGNSADEGAGDTDREKYNCPVEATLDVIGGKWKIVNLGRLKQRAYRFSEPRKLILGVSERMLTQHLRELERDGIVRRTVFP